MQSFRSMATAVRQRVFRKSVKQQTKELDPAVRKALADDIVNDYEDHDLEHQIQQIEKELQDAKQALKETEQKETFLGQRSRQYRLALDDRARSLALEQREIHELVKQQREQQNNNTDDEENNNNQTQQRQDKLDELMEHWERDETALLKVVETHKGILATCETMRRQIQELERKQMECRTMAGENQDFLETAVASRQADTNATVLAVADHAAAADVEMSHLVPASSSPDHDQDEDDGPEETKEEEETEQQDILVA